MKELLIHFKKLDWALILSVIFLGLFGLLSIYSSSRGDFLNFKKQIIFFIIGFFLMIIISFFDWRGLKDNTHFILIFYFLCLIGLLGLYFMPEIRGVNGWYKIGPVTISPIEFTKIILVILLAKYFSMRHEELYRVRHILFSGLYVFLAAALIFFQPDFGSVIILVSLWIGILIVSGIKIRHFFMLCFLLFLSFALSWSFLLKPYQKARISSFLTPQFQPLGINWNQNQAKIAIGSGGIFGQGIGSGSQTQYGFLPEPQTDFTFAAISEETGLIGVSFLFFLFLILFWRIFKIALSSQSNFPRLFTSGLAIIFLAQIFIHIGMNVGILPVIGIPLPLVSYGGSGLVAAFIGLGILQSIKIH